MTDRAGNQNPNWRGGTTSHPFYWIYKDMVGRCTRVTHPRYCDYGARGIEVSERWLANFWNFVEDMGERPAGRTPGGRPVYSLDRIDNDRGYSRENCRWADLSEQARNKRGFGPSVRDSITGRFGKVVAG